MLEALREFIRSDSIEVALANPVLLSTEWHDQLRKADRTSEVDSALRKLKRVADLVRERAWALGVGPLDAIFEQVQEGRVTQAHGVVMAAAPDLTWRLSASYVARMSAVAENMAHTGKWKDGVLLARLMLHAVEARRTLLEFEQESMEFTATVCWINVVTRAVWEVPDPHLFHDAVARGEKLAYVIDDPRGASDPATVLHLLGTLYLDPYTANRSNAQPYQVQHAAWMNRFRVATAGGTNSNKSKLAMPEPAEALRKAADYLERAARHRSGEALGRSRKAQLQALVWQRILGLSPGYDEFERIAGEAIQVLDAPEVQGLRTEVLNMRAWFRGKEGSAKDDEADPVLLRQAQMLLGKPVQGSLRGVPAELQLSQYTQTALAILKWAPQQAFELWTRAQVLGRQQAAEARTQFFLQGLLLLHQAYAPHQVSSATGSLQAAFKRLATSDDDDFTRAAKLLSLAYHSAQSDEEEQAIEIVEAASLASEEFKRTYPELLKEARAALLLGAAVNRYNVREFEEASSLYMQSAMAFLDCESPTRAMDAVERVVDIARRESPRALYWFIKDMGVVAPRLEGSSPGVPEHLQRLYRETLGLLMRPGELKLIVFIMFLEMVKGTTFAHALLEGGPRDWLASKEAREMEAQIAGLTKESVAQPDVSPTKLDFEWILTSYVSSQEQAGGSTPAERLRNARIAFEGALGEAQRSRVTQRRWITTEDTVQQVLGPKSALLAMYVGQLPDGDAANFLLLLTQDDFYSAQAKLAGFNVNLMSFGDGEQRISLSPFALSIAGLHRSIQEDPLTRNVSAKAATQLLTAQENLLGGGLKEKLHGLRAAGKEHLYIWPHGPFHFAPVHLFGPEDAPLAEEWNVTYLSSLNLLDPARSWKVPLAEFMAIGLDFPDENARGLPSLIDAEAEALDVTRVMNAPRALTGAALNKQAVLEALQGHRRVHIATHGDLPVSTPCFQSLYLSPDPAGDVLYAYEIQRLELKGVDLVTLSACETALGRFDIGDNLRGFPASLLMAGVSTIIGTMWPVESRCARYFFVCLYGAVRDGATKGDAFRKAQIQTRRQFPQYRDWGAFYLSGAIA
ncbi:hypothetical protein A8M77_33895 [Variovorax sp. JS1663]|nr:hypothetical protein A8M77_33895 [Variovorax sp. JS1663]